MPNLAVEHDGAQSGEAMAPVRVRTANRTGQRLDAGSVPDAILRLVNACPLCSVQMTNRPQIHAEHAVAFAADAPVVNCHILVVPKEHVASIHALPHAAQKGIWSVLSEARDRLRTGLMPDAGFSIGFVDALSAVQPVDHALIHIIPRRQADRIALPECSEWISDDGILFSTSVG